jgi:hypothetical protein
VKSHNTPIPNVLKVIEAVRKALEGSSQSMKQNRISEVVKTPNYSSIIFFRIFFTKFDEDRNTVTARVLINFYIYIQMT